jgi:hypothetical protein
VVGVAGAEDLGEAVVAGLTGEVAEALRAGAEVGGVAVEVAAVGGAAHRGVARHAAEAAVDGDRPVAHGVSHGLELPHRDAGVRAGLARREPAAGPVGVAAVQLGVGEVDRRAVVVLERVDLAERRRACHAVRAEAVRLLEPGDGGLRAGAEHAVEGEDAAVARVAGHADLELADVVAGGALGQGTAPGVTGVGGVDVVSGDGAGVGGRRGDEDGQSGEQGRESEEDAGFHRREHLSTTQGKVTFRSVSR